VPLALALLVVGALVPFWTGLDTGVATALESWRSCRTDRLAEVVSDWTRPAGIGLLVAVLLARWRALGTGRIIDLVLAFAAGALSIEALKRLLERARPGAEFLGELGDSFPSGHVGNTVLAGLALVGLLPRRYSAALACTVGAGTTVVAAARVASGQHWASDVLGSAGLLGGFGTLALLHPNPRHRRLVTTASAVAAAALLGAAALGLRLRLPGAGVTGEAPLAYHRAGDLLAAGALRGPWAADAPDPRRRSVWLSGERGEMVLPAGDGGAAVLRIVSRPHPGGASAHCRWLVVAVDGRPVGERLLRMGWRAYSVALAPPLAAGVEHVVTLAVRDGLPDGRKPDAPRAAFSELSLHAAAGREAATARAVDAGHGGCDKPRAVATVGYALVASVDVATHGHLMQDVARGP